MTTDEQEEKGDDKKVGGLGHHLSTWSWESTFTLVVTFCRDNYLYSDTLVTGD